MHACHSILRYFLNFSVCSQAEFSGTEYPFPWMTQRKGKHTKIKILSRKDLLRRLEESSMDGIIECFPLQSVLWTLGISQIDLLVLDIDGHEFAVLKDFPFDLVSVKVSLQAFGY